MTHLKQYNSHRSKQLTMKQLKFCEAYIENGGDSRKAAIEAGYAESSASVSANYQLNQPNIQKFLKSKMKPVEKKIGITFEWKMKKLKKIVDNKIPDDSEIIEDASVAIQAIAEMNRMQGDYAPTKSINANLNVEADKEQLDLLIEEHRREF